MALTNVWCQNQQGEWVRTNAELEKKNFSYHTTAGSRLFRCYSCFHYVEYYPNPKKQSCHFRHYSGDKDKDCEDRNPGKKQKIVRDAWNMPTPMRLQILGGQPTLAIGFLSIDQAQIDQLAAESATWTFSSTRGTPIVYLVDAGRFSPYETTWLPIPVEWATSIRAKFQAKSTRPARWNRPVKPIASHGAVFDCITGRKVEERGDVEVGHEYWLLCSTDDFEQQSMI